MSIRGTFVPSKIKLWPFAAGSLYMWGQLGLVSPLISAVSRSKTRSLSWCGLLVFWREACSCMIMLWFCVVIIILRDIAHMIRPLYITVFESFKKSNKGHIWAISRKILCVMPVFNMPCSWFWKKEIVWRSLSNLNNSAQTSYYEEFNAKRISLFCVVLWYLWVTALENTVLSMKNLHTY